MLYYLDAAYSLKRSFSLLKPFHLMLDLAMSLFLTPYIWNLAGIHVGLKFLIAYCTNR